MQSDTYTLVLTNASHLVDAETADRIAGAVSKQIPSIEVILDLFGDGSSIRSVRLMTRHIVMLIKNPPELPTDKESDLLALIRGKVRPINSPQWR